MRNKARSESRDGAVTATASEFDVEMELMEGLLQNLEAAVRGTRANVEHFAGTDNGELDGEDAAGTTSGGLARLRRNIRNLQELTDIAMETRTLTMKVL